jgi:hypothetical protein
LTSIQLSIAPFLPIISSNNDPTSSSNTSNVDVTLSPTLKADSKLSTSPSSLSLSSSSSVLDFYNQVGFQLAQIVCNICNEII